MSKVSDAAGGLIDGYVAVCHENPIERIAGVEYLPTARRAPRGPLPLRNVAVKLRSVPRHPFQHQAFLHRLPMLDQYCHYMAARTPGSNPRVAPTALVFKRPLLIRTPPLDIRCGFYGAPGAIFDTRPCGLPYDRIWLLFS